MSITRTYGNIEFVCDNCSDGLDADTDDWGSAKTQLDAEGWLARKDGDDWLHFCSRDCLKEYQDED